MTWSRNVFSSMVNQIEWDDEGMIVTWRNGKRSMYVGVDEETALSCAQAASVGQFINSQIKPNYNHRYV